MATNRGTGRPNTRRRMGTMSLAASMIPAVLVAIPLLAQAKDPINYTTVFGHTDGTTGTTTTSGVGNDNKVFIAEAGGTAWGYDSEVGDVDSSHHFGFLHR